MFKAFTTTAALMIVTLAMGSTAQAQQQVETQLQQVQQYQIDPQVTPPVYNGPKLGVVAIGKGNSVEVTQAFYGTPAKRLGLEPGDRLLEINGQPVRSIAELRHRLQDAVYNHNGQIRVLIDNVRARHGHWGAQRFVSASTYLDGYGHLANNYPPYPGPVYSEPVVTSQLETTSNW